MELDEHCQLSTYTDRGFHAIGSAAGFAQMANAMLAHFRLEEHPLDYGKHVAYRVMDAVIHTAAMGVGEPIQMWWINEDGVVTELDDAERKRIRDNVGQWQDSEREVLADLMRDDPDDAAPAMPPETTGDTG